MVYNVLVVDFSFQVNYTTIKTAVSFFEMAVLFFYSAFIIIYTLSHGSRRLTPLHKNLPFHYIFLPKNECFQFFVGFENGLINGVRNTYV